MTSVEEKIHPGVKHSPPASNLPCGTFGAALLMATVKITSKAIHKHSKTLLPFPHSLQLNFTDKLKFKNAPLYLSHDIYE
jgi:hypothetical protein